MASHSPSLRKTGKAPQATARVAPPPDADLLPLGRHNSARRGSGRPPPPPPPPLPRRRTVGAAHVEEESPITRSVVGPQPATSGMPSSPSAHLVALDPSGPSDGFLLPASATGVAAGRTKQAATVADCPPTASGDGTALLDDTASCVQDEQYGDDERKLNDFLTLHPMLNLESTSAKTLQLVGSMFDKCGGVQAPELPVIPKSHDDRYLRPPNKRIGERECACGNRCLCVFMAKFRHGADTPLAFVCTEFLLPEEQLKFSAGDGLPAQRKKCLVCLRYFTSYLYYLCRVDPTFKLENAAIDFQTFSNSLAAPLDDSVTPPDLEALQNGNLNIPSSSSAVATKDGYRPDAMLFVDEEFSNRRAARSPPLSNLQWRPVVRFCSRHYVYCMTVDGPRITQAGVGADDPSETGLLFQEAPAANAAAPSELHTLAASMHSMAALIDAHPWLLEPSLLSATATVALLSEAQLEGVATSIHAAQRAYGIVHPENGISSRLLVSNRGRYRHCAATFRMACAVLIETHATMWCDQLLQPGGTIAGEDADEQCALACQLYADCHAAAVWTSAHATYLANALSGVLEPPDPSIFSVVSSYTSLDITDLYSRRGHPKSCPKATQVLLQLISRCTNPGARGWDTVLAVAVASTSIRHVLYRELEVCLTGMHPQIHPSLRPSWDQRLKISRVCADVLVGESASDVVKLHVEMKEVVRRLVASTMAAAPAMHAAMSRLGHPVRHLLEPPSRFPTSGMEAAMAAFAVSGARMINQARLPGLFDCVSAEFAVAKSMGIGNLHWSVGWLGKGTCDTHSAPTVVELAAEVWMAGFKTHFIAFWMHGMSHTLRVSRLDAVQHEAIHNMNAATALCAALSTSERLRIQRLAFQNPSSSVLTLAEVAVELGINTLVIPNGTFKTPTDIIKCMATSGPENVARILCYARVAWILGGLFVVNLGEEVARRQSSMLARRLRRTSIAATNDDQDIDDVLSTTYDTLPVHSTCLCVCTECQRVANAHVSYSAGDKPGHAFNELGVSQSMICWHDGRLHCSKRSSAALRGSISFQEFMRRRRIEDEYMKESSIDALVAPRQVTGVESGIAARVRRDAKNALEQRSRASSCSECAMLTVPLMGRIIRIYGSWYAHCELCAAVTRVTPMHRFGAEICCLRCDHSILYREEEDGGGLFDEKTAENEKRVCRYCGGVDPERSGARWKQVKAPFDVAGPNSNIPAPLRTVWYCPSHFRSWVVGAHRVMETRVILAHLGMNAKPIFGLADQTTRKGKRREDEEEDYGDDYADECDVRTVKPKKGKKTKRRRSLPTLCGGGPSRLG